MTEAQRGDEAWISEWGDVTATAIERDIVRYGAVPDLADVLARARAMDPEAVPDGWDDLVVDEDDDGIVGLAQARALQRAVPDAGVGGFASALRADIEVGLHERSMSAIPIAPQSRRRWPIAAAAVALAAAVVLWMAGPRILAQLDASRSPSTAEAVQSASPDREVEQWHERVPESPSPPAVTPIEVPELEAEDATSTGALEADTDDAARTTPRRARPTLDQLEAEALAAWRAGDLATAERLMHAIAKSGRSSRAELAYGDLFSLARQRRGVAGQVAMWREYLRRFPRGRFADDARGGLCRRADEADTARSCWTDYLRHHPSGTYAAEASRWTTAPQ